MDLRTLCKQFRVTVSLLKTLTQKLKKKKTEVGTNFTYLVATPVPANQHKQTNKQFCLFNVQRVKGSFSAHNFQETMSILQACTSNCPCVLQALLLIIKTKSQLSKRMRTDCTILILKLSNHQNIPFQVFYPTP